MYILLSVCQEKSFSKGRKSLSAEIFFVDLNVCPATYRKPTAKDVFKSIKYGWQDKGMQPWKDFYKPIQIAQLTSFIKSLKGTNPPGAKEKQGELYVEEVVASMSTSDSTKTK